MKRHQRSISLYVVVVALAISNGCVLVRTEPPHPGHLADKAIAEGDTARGIRLLEKLVASRDAPAERYMQLGALYRASHSIAGRHRSAQALERGLRLLPDHMGLQLEMGKTKYEQTFYPDAARCFERVLQLDPGQCEAHFYLGLNWFRKWKHVQVYTDYLDQARAHFAHVVDCDPNNKDAHFKLAISIYAQGDTALAIDTADRFIARHAESAEGFLLRGTLAFQRFDYELCRSSFADAFSLLSGDEQDRFRDIALLLPEDEVWDYQHASPEKREGLHRVFWAEEDPDPTTPVNERYLEHIQRMFLADTFFGHHAPRLRGWQTERGKA
ncbi:MAG: GWxTD domain-containing protein, partial [Candidatus Krumholzibacteria bacterium]|nr:GWxTD domain-containing protein [Candidatus Krumholzibacteria bacterium]